VRLTAGFEAYGDAKGGPLKPGDVGTLCTDDGSSKPFHVEASDGRKWWYDEKAIELADGVAAPSKPPKPPVDPELIVTRANFVLGAKVIRGPDWKWDDQDGGDGKEGTLKELETGSSDGWCRVEWDSGGSNSYRVDTDDKHDLQFVEKPTGYKVSL
jgi:hypothetical protein